MADTKISALPAASAVAVANEFAINEAGTSKKVTGAQVKAFAAPIGTAAIAFTDGDTVRRTTITDAEVAATDKIVLTVRRPDSTDDSADAGYVYLANVVKVAAGSFDVLIACLGWGMDDCTERPPNETITLSYMRAA